MKSEPRKKWKRVVQAGEERISMRENRRQLALLITVFNN